MTAPIEEIISYSTYRNGQIGVGDLAVIILSERAAPFNLNVNRMRFPYRRAPPGSQLTIYGFGSVGSWPPNGTPVGGSEILKVANMNVLSDDACTQSLIFFGQNRTALPVGSIICFQSTSEASCSVSLCQPNYMLY